MRNDFAVFICTHGRPTAQLTLEMLKREGYTGKWYLVLDDTDSTIQQYIDIYGKDNVVIFNKNHYINSDDYDNGDNILHDKCILYAKRAVEDIARYLKLDYFAIVDDDFVKLSIRYPEEGKLKRMQITDLDSILDAYIELLSNNITALGFGAVATYCDGVNALSPSHMSKRYLPYQFIMRNAKFEVNWTSWMAEDDVTELQSSMVGGLWLVIPYVMQETKPIGDTKASGGMVDTYKNSNTYELNFNAVKNCPHRIYLRQRKDGKLILARRYDRCFPKIISGRYKHGI